MGGTAGSARFAGRRYLKRIKDREDTRLLEEDTHEYPEGEVSRRQDLEPCYLRNGAIYSMTRDCIVEKFSRHGDISRAYIMDENVSVNVDTMLDFKLAEILLKENK